MAELIRRRGLCDAQSTILRSRTAKWVDWWNNRRLHGACGDIPPAEFEANYYREQEEASPVA
jgi:putative transposase